jgi:hypothetical protein
MSSETEVTVLYNQAVDSNQTETLAVIVKASHAAYDDV